MSTYATVAEADAYFGGRLDHDIWDASSPDDKLRALTTATRLIDRLNFLGDKADADQELEFPRGTDTVVPRDIKYACYESAFALLDSVDVEHEARLIMTQATGLSMVKKQNDVTAVNEWTIHGIPSAVAWSYLRPFLRDPGSITISRVN